MREKGDEEMKKIGEYTARGIVSEQETEGGLPQKIPLYDGRGDTAYKVVDFQIWAVNFSGSSHPDCIGKLSKNADGSTASTTFFRADDHNQIAWSTSAGSTDGGFSIGQAIIDPDNLVVEDLYVYARHAGTTGPVNYMIVMEKYEISDWQGALAMARDRAQGDL
tara:strand:- start:27 stop:518 length:492 start_codon:yes stop_codon:yes gene_type:complete